MIWKSLATCFFVRIDKGYIILANNSQGYKSKVEYWKYKKRSIANASKRVVLNKLSDIFSTNVDFLINGYYWIP